MPTAIPANGAVSHEDIARRFAELFVGSTGAHGVLLLKDGVPGDHRTADGPATPADYAEHLAGTKGLGLVPVREDGTCRFGAIDIDEDTINHQQLYEKVRSYGMPLTVCRSKSGGAHLYLFMPEPGQKASRVITTLKRWAGVLGYANAEIFPKQLAISKKIKGNWINCCYFGSDSSNRYAVLSDGAVSLAEFLGSVTWWDGKDHVGVGPEAVLPILGQTQMPPCLAYLAEHGLPDGKRNQGMFNFAIFARKALPNGWEERVLEYNKKYCSPPLAGTEIERIIKSVGTTKYQYKCDQEPIVSHCDRTTCLTLPFGVGHMPWKEQDALGSFLCSHLRKVDSDPPTYLVEINGLDVTLNSEEFFEFPRLRDRVEELLDVVVPVLKPDRWDAMRMELHKSQEIIDAPDDASTDGQLINDVMDYLARFRTSREADDILRGTPVEQAGFICFRVTDLQKFLKGIRRQFIDNSRLYAVLHRYGGRHKPIKIRGRAVKVWMFPVDRLNIQTEDYAPATFGEFGEDM